MEREQKSLPQELGQQVKGKMRYTNNNHGKADTEDNDIQTDSAVIIGQGDPNLSPDAGKPMI
ncbi:hypothetical protein [Neobacillus muris]|uniref:hypothetical protein n=1 Tax=Neobacillus muris TaxID=2941334 RepID=UPI00203BB31D|nr:hypothetical protein [Neobacillus muris]